jgi:protein gp37
VQWGNHPRKRTSESYWKQPLKWAKAARALDYRPRVFCASLADVFDNQVPQEWRADLFALIDFTPELDWLLLTKRPENIHRFLPSDLSSDTPRHNVWLGITAEDQERFDHRWPILREIPAVVRFISYEPAIGPLNLGVQSDFPDWIICGGESGHGARMMDLAWARGIRAQCQTLGVKFFFKQTTGKGPIPDDLMVRQFPREAT